MTGMLGKAVRNPHPRLCVQVVIRKERASRRSNTFTCCLGRTGCRCRKYHRIKRTPPVIWLKYRGIPQPSQPKYDTKICVGRLYLSPVARRVRNRLSLRNLKDGEVRRQGVHRFRSPPLHFMAGMQKKPTLGNLLGILLLLRTIIINGAD